MHVKTFPVNLKNTSGLLILLHGVISLSDATSYDKYLFLPSRYKTSKLRRFNIDVTSRRYVCPFTRCFKCQKARKESTSHDICFVPSEPGYDLKTTSFQRRCDVTLIRSCLKGCVLKNSMRQFMVQT